MLLTPFHNMMLCSPVDHHRACRPAAAGAARLPARNREPTELSERQLADAAELAAFLAAHPGHPRRADHDHRSVGRAARQVGAARGTGAHLRLRAARSPAPSWDSTSAARTSMPPAWSGTRAMPTCAARPDRRHAETRALAAGAHRPAHAHHVRWQGRAGRGRSAPRAGARASSASRALGMTPVVACELEFYLLREEAGGRLVPAGGGRAQRAAEDRRLQPARGSTISRRCSTRCIAPPPRRTCRPKR